MTDLVLLLFIAMIPIECKITNFSLHLFDYFFVAIIIFDEFISTTSSERMTTNTLFSWVPHLLINEKFICQYSRFENCMLRYCTRQKFAWLNVTKFWKINHLGTFDT